MSFAIAESYEDVEGILKTLAESHRKASKGLLTFEEALSDANEAFMRAYSSYDGSAKFATWVWQTVSYRLLEVRRQAAHKARVNRSRVEGYADYVAHAVTGESRRLRESLEELAGDARVVVGLVLDTPEEVLAAADAKGGRPPQVRKAITDHLRSIGWTIARVKEAFEEISFVLSN